MLAAPGSREVGRYHHLLLTSWARGAVGSASDWQSEGQGFESPRVHQIFEIRIDPWHHCAPKRLGSCSLSASYFLADRGGVLPRAREFAMAPELPLRRRPASISALRHRPTGRRGATSLCAHLSLA